MQPSAPARLRQLSDVAVDLLSNVASVVIGIGMSLFLGFNVLPASSPLAALFQQPPLSWIALVFLIIALAFGAWLLTTFVARDAAQTRTDLTRFFAFTVVSTLLSAVLSAALGIGQLPTAIPAFADLRFVPPVALALGGLFLYRKIAYPCSGPDIYCGPGSQGDTECNYAATVTISSVASGATFQAKPEQIAGTDPMGPPCPVPVLLKPGDTAQIATDFSQPASRGGSYLYGIVPTVTIISGSGTRTITLDKLWNVLVIAKGQVVTEQIVDASGQQAFPYQRWQPAGPCYAVGQAALTEVSDPSGHWCS